MHQNNSTTFTFTRQEKRKKIKVTFILKISPSLMYLFNLKYDLIV
jgi:hypothetical protein